MSIRISREEPGFVLSAVVHVALLVIGLLGLADAKTFEDAQESVPVEIMTESQLKQLTQGEKTAKQVIPDAKLRVDKVAPEQKQDDPGEKKQEVAAPLPAPALPPSRPVDLAKSDPQKAEPKKAEPVEPPPKQAAALPPVKPVEVAKVEPAKAEPVKKVALAQPSQEDEEVDPEAEVIRQAAKKAPIPRKDDVPKAEVKPDPMLKLLEQQKAEDARKKAEEAKREEARKEEAKKLAEAKRLEELKKAIEAKRVADAEAKKLAEAKEAEAERLEEQKQAEAKKAAEQKKIADAKAAAAEAAADAKADAEEKANADAKAKADAEAKKKALAKAAADAEAKRQADFNKLLRAKLASSSTTNGGNGQQVPTDRAASATGSTGAQINRSNSSLGAPSATGQKLNPAERAGLSEAVADQVSPKVSYSGDKPKVLPQFKIVVGRDGSLLSQPQLANSSNDPSFQALAAAGARAIRAAAPFRIEARYASSYEDWKNMIIQINPDS